MSPYQPMSGTSRTRFTDDKEFEVSRYPIDPQRAKHKEDWYAPSKTSMFSAMRATVATILKHPHDLRWTVQGFGFMRCYPGMEGKTFRLNVWDDALKVPGVSTIHDHPWDFESWIINGNFRNVRYVEDANGDEFQYMLIKTGENGGSKPESASRLRLRALPVEHYKTGDTYRQSASEIHETLYDSGTVTLNARVGDTEQARVFWADENGKGYWVDAKPREATRAEIEEAAARARGKWEKL